MRRYTSPHDGVLGSLQHARHRKDQHLEFRRQLDRLPRPALVALCESLGLPHAGRADEALRADLFGASERLGRLPEPGRATWR